MPVYNKTEVKIKPGDIVTIKNEVSKIFMVIGIICINTYCDIGIKLIDLRTVNFVINRDRDIMDLINGKITIESVIQTLKAVKEYWHNANYIPRQLSFLKSFNSIFKENISLSDWMV